MTSFYNSIHQLLEGLVVQKTLSVEQLRRPLNLIRRPHDWEGLHIHRAQAGNV